MSRLSISTILIAKNAYRRQRLARKLMDDLEDITEKVHKAYFVDLFVRVSNASAIRMYNKVSRQRAPSATSIGTGAFT